MAMAAAAACFGVGYLLAVFVLFPAPEAPTDGVAVPKLVGQDSAYAAQALARLRLRVAEATPLPDPEAPAGIIVAQDPLPGQQLRAGDAVRIAISSGPPLATLPEVGGLAAARAQALLESLGFRVTQQVESALSPAGTVTRTDPRAGLPYTLPQDVRLFVSTGPPTQPVDTLPPADTLGAPAGVQPRPAPPMPGVPARPAPPPDTIP
ncbi:MAG TPA: PASTA domain-containing protein [Longimicrobiales bacterium]|nr:PASTA domain-containing protein [Longimicrobiales bacterium]